MLSYNQYFRKFSVERAANSSSALLGTSIAKQCSFYTGPLSVILFCLWGYKITWINMEPEFYLKTCLLCIRLT